MDYEKKYKNALERAKEVWEQGMMPESIEYIFPELKESIKNEIIEFLRLPHPQFVGERNHELWIAWFEKQGEKPTDKVEPKFKVGNWYQCTKDFFGKGVTFDKNTAYYCAKEGCLQNEYGCHIAIVKDLYDNFKLWTIQDAKDGDVLVCDINKAEIGGDVEKLPNITPTICIYQNVVKDKDYIHTYCSLYNESSLIVSNSMYYNTFVYNIHPATKEQRDLLFSKMKEAGYEWDSENKELKKFEGKKEVKKLDADNDFIERACEVLQEKIFVSNDIIYLFRNAMLEE